MDPFGSSRKASLQPGFTLSGFHEHSPPNKHCRRRSLRQFVSMLVVSCMLGNTAEAAFQMPFLTARSRAMGASSLATERDPAAVFTNPSGMAGLTNLEAYFSSTNMFAGLSGVDTINTGFVAMGLPTRAGSLGMGVGIFHASSLMQEQTLAVGLAKPMWDRVQVGITGKYLYHTYMPETDPLAANDPVFRNGTSKSAFAFDVGAVAPLKGPVRFQLAVRNVNEPDVGLMTTDRVGREFEAGSVVRFLGWTAAGGFSLARSAQGIQQMVPSLGLEKDFMDRVAFRFGFSSTEWGGGIGLRVGRVGFDYALILNQKLGSEALSHTIGLRYQFGGSQ